LKLSDFGLCKHAVTLFVLHPGNQKKNWFRKKKWKWYQGPYLLLNKKTLTASSKK
jgi:hypothetical protein